jgi:hypothetical protein
MCKAVFYLERKMKRFIDFLSDRRNLCKFYLYAMMVIIAVVPFFFEQGTDLSFFYTIMRLGYCAWTAFILIGDLVHHQVPPGLLSRSSAALTAAACLSLIFGARAPSAGQIAGIGYLIMTSYVVVSIGYYYSDSFSEDFDPILRLLATELFLLISVSLVMFLFYQNGWNTVLGIPIEAVTSWRGDRTRYFGIMGYATSGGYHCVAGIILSFYLTEKKKLPRWFCYLNTVLSLLMILLADARNAYLEVAIVFAFILYRQMRKRVSKKASLWILFAGACALILGYVFTHAGTFKASSSSSEEFINSFSSGRLGIWKAAVSGFLQYPIFGQGWLNGDVVNAYYSAITNAHNAFVNVLLWTGAAGFIPFCIYLFEGLKKVWNNRIYLKDPSEQWLIILVICIFWGSMLSSVAFVGDDSHLPGILFFLALGHLYYLNCHAEGAAQ